MFGRRRRPLVRAAAVGGAGYAIGKRRARVEAEDAAYEDEAAAEDQTGLDASQMDDLEKLADLKDRGILTEQEFDEQKAKILGSA